MSRFTTSNPKNVCYCVKGKLKKQKQNRMQWFANHVNPYFIYNRTQNIRLENSPFEEKWYRFTNLKKACKTNQIKWQRKDTLSYSEHNMMKGLRESVKISVCKGEGRFNKYSIRCSRSTDSIITTLKTDMVLSWKSLYVVPKIINE